MNAQAHQQEWQQAQTIAENLLPKIAQLYRKKGIELLMFGKTLVDASTIDMIKLTHLAHRYTHQSLNLQQIEPLIEQLCDMPLSPCYIDIGKLSQQYKRHEPGSIGHFLVSELREALNGQTVTAPKDVVLYGFGRIWGVY